MTESRQYDTVAFDVRDNATMLFFAKTTEVGDISDGTVTERARSSQALATDRGYRVTAPVAAARLRHLACLPLASHAV